MANTGGTMTKKQKNKIKRNLKKVHSGYIVIAVIFLALGAVLGVMLASHLTANDSFTLNGDSIIYVNVGDGLNYKDEGITCISTGTDVSDSVTITTNMALNTNGCYTADTSVAGEYYIKYTVTQGRYEGLCRVRVFKVRESGSAE